MIQSLKDIALAEDFRKELHQALQHPCILQAISVLKEENMPSFVVKAIPGLARRCGAQEVLKMLYRLPHLTPRIAGKADDLGGPWEYLSQEIDKEKTEKEQANKKSK